MAAPVVVVGAGIAGLVAARTLQRDGHAVVVLDKARGVGGRAATRRVGGATFDSGAQFFTARDASFAALVRELVDAGVAAPWFEGRPEPDGALAPDGDVRHRGVPGMTALAKHLARGLDVRCSARVAAVEPHDRGPGWRVTFEGVAPAVDASAVVLTPPVPQSVALVDAGGVAVDPVARAALDAISYDRCLAVLVRTDPPARLDPPGAWRPASEPVEWIGDNHVKGVSAEPGALTVHAGPATSEALWDAPDAEVVATLVAGAAAHVGPIAVVDAHVHRWRYSRPRSVLPEPCAVLARDPAPLVVAGDACAGPRVEGAARSGAAAAATIAAPRTRGDDPSEPGRGAGVR